MPISNFPNGFADGVLIRGVPVAITNPGETFWVNSTSVLPLGGKSPSGNSPGTYQEPVATIAQAFDLCKASRGDVIAVMPGYTETVSAAAGLAFDVAGVAVIGLGQGGNKPTISFSATGSTLTVTAASVSVTNFRFVSTVANMVTALDITGAAFAVDQCEFMASAAATAILNSIRASATATGLRVTNCTINQESSVAGLVVSDVAATGIITLADNSYIQNNHILGRFNLSAIVNATTAAVGLVIDSNTIYNSSTTTAAGGISMTAGCTGLATNNLIGCLESGSIDDHLVNASCSPNRTFGCNVITETGGVIGTAAT